MARGRFRFPEPWLARDIPEGEPRQFVAGDTVQFTKSLMDFAPADGWTLKYALVGPQKITGSPFTAAVVDGQWQVTIPATASKDVVSTGTWRLLGWVELDGERYTIYDGVVALRPNVELASLSGLQTHEERALAIIEARIEGRLTADLETYQIDGRAVTKIPVKELLALRAHYRHLVWKQRNRGRAAPSRKVVFNAVD